MPTLGWNRPIDTCESVWGSGIGKTICETIGIKYPGRIVWPDYKDWYDPSAYRFSSADIGYVILIAVFLTFLRYRIQGVSVSVARRLKVADTHKFSESIWKTLFYVTSFSWGMYLIAARDFVWAYDYDEVFREVPSNYETGNVATDLRFFYLFQIGFYSHSIYAHLFIETRRKDFYQMLIHHVATLGLVSISYTTRFLEIGTLIVALHDFSDILFEIAKLFVYCKNDVLANVWFALWVLSWIVLRLMYYPYWIVYGSIYESLGHLGHYPHYASCAFMLVLLQILHIFWFYLIASMIVRLVTGDAKKLTDTREVEKSGKKKKN